MGNQTSKYKSILVIFAAILLCAFISTTSRAQTITPGDARPWFKADLHTHYTFGGPLEAEIARHRETGYQFLVLSTKDTQKAIKYSKFSNPDMIVIEGVEQAFVTRLNKLGHVIAFPVKTPYPFTTSWTLKEGYAKLRAKNKDVVLGINHPHDGRWSLEDVMEAAAEGVTFFELNSIDMKHGEFEIALWDKVLAGGAKLYATLTNDTHQFADIDAYGYVMIRGEKLALEDMLAALRAGDFYAVESGCAAKPARYEIVNEASNKVLQIEVPGAAEIRIFGDGKQLYAEKGEKASYAIDGITRYIRAEIIDGQGRYLFLQPFFF